MIKRKVITTLLATPLSLLVIFGFFFGEWARPMELIVMIGTLSLLLSPFILLYGVPVTFLSEYIGKFSKGNVRTLVALIVHISFGTLFGFIAPLNGELTLGMLNASSIFAMITALFFWIIDELLRRKRPKTKISYNKLTDGNSRIVLLFLLQS